MDEIFMRFEFLLSRIFEFSGSRIVLVKFCGVKKRSFIVILVVFVDGSKLLFVVIFKGVRISRDFVVLDFVGVSFYKKGWMDEKGKLLSCFFFFI